jgi:hypothetical protein
MPADGRIRPGAPNQPDGPDAPELRRLRRRLAFESLGISLSAGAFGLVYGLAARNAGFSLIEAMAMSVFVIAGAAQFAAVGLVAQAVPWPAIVLLTALLNARHLLYSAALAPWVAGRRNLERAAMAHVLTDETFALSLAHFQRVDEPTSPATGSQQASSFCRSSPRPRSGWSAARQFPTPPPSDSTSSSRPPWQDSAWPLSTGAGNSWPRSSARQSRSVWG